LQAEGHSVASDHTCGIGGSVKLLLWVQSTKSICLVKGWPLIELRRFVTFSSAGQYATSHCKPLLVGFPSE